MDYNCTDRLRRVMQLANQEAQRFNHEYIGTEHMLLGLIKEGSGVAAMALANLEVDLRKVRLAVEKIVQCGPDVVTMGKLPTTPRARAVIQQAQLVANEWGHTYCGPEHLLIGLLREKEGVAAQVLTMLGATAERTYDEVVRLLGLQGDARRRALEDNPRSAAEYLIAVEEASQQYESEDVELVFPVNGRAASFTFTKQVDREGFLLMHRQLSLAEESLLGRERDLGLEMAIHPRGSKACEHLDQAVCSVMEVRNMVSAVRGEVSDEMVAEIEKAAKALQSLAAEVYMAKRKIRMR